MTEEKIKQEEKPVKVEEKKVEKIVKKPEEKKVIDAKKKVEKKPKEIAVVNGISLRISTKYCIAISRMIKGKTPERAVEMLEEVVKKKRAVKMPSREVAHQKGKGVAGGKFPKSASLEMIKLLNQLVANSSVNGIENPVITIAKANKASRPFRREGRRAKRTHVYIEVKDRTKLRGSKK